MHNKDPANSAFTKGKYRVSSETLGEGRCSSTRPKTLPIFEDTSIKFPPKMPGSDLLSKLAGKPPSFDIDDSSWQFFPSISRPSQLQKSFLSFDPNPNTPAQKLMLASNKESRNENQNKKNILNFGNFKDPTNESFLLTPLKKRSFNHLEFSFKKENEKTAASRKSQRTELADLSGIYGGDYKSMYPSPDLGQNLLNLNQKPLLQSQSQQTGFLPLETSDGFWIKGYSPKRKISSLSPFFNLGLTKPEPSGLSPFFKDKKKPLVFNTPKNVESPHPKLKHAKLQKLTNMKTKQPVNRQELTKNEKMIYNKNLFSGKKMSLLESENKMENPLYLSKVKEKQQSTLQSAMNINVVNFNTPQSLYCDPRPADSMHMFGSLLDIKEGTRTKDEIGGISNLHISFDMPPGDNNHKDDLDSKSQFKPESKMNQIMQGGQDSINEFYQHDLSSLHKSENHTILWKGEKERKDSHCSEFMPPVTHSLFSQNSKMLKKKEGRKKRKKDSFDTGQYSKENWTQDFLKKRSRPEGDKGQADRRKKRGKRKKIIVREINCMNVKKHTCIEYFKKLTEKVLNRRNKNSKRIFLKEKNTFYLRKANYFRPFNPILFDIVEPKSEKSFSELPSQKEKSRTIKDYFPAIKASVQGYDFIKKELERTKKQQLEGKMSLNKFDFFKSQIKDEDKKSLSNFDIKGRSSVPKMMTPDLVSLNFPIKKEEAFWGKGSDMINEKIIQDWDSFNNATPSKHLDGENMIKFHTQDMKLTPAKLPSEHSFLAYETPIREQEEERKNQEEDVKLKLKSIKKKIEYKNDFMEGNNYNIKSPFMLNTMEDILNNKSLKIKKPKNPTPKPSDTKKYFLRRETSTVILQGPLEDSSLDRNPGYSSNHTEKRRRRPDAEEIENVPRKCNCRLTACLKKYCSCFSAGKVCGPDCECQGCCNQEGNPRRSEILKKAKLLNKNAAGKEKSKKKVGCKCSSSGCTKKYCECFRKGVFCMESCRCVNCKNARPLSPEL